MDELTYGIALAVNVLLTRVVTEYRFPDPLPLQNLLNQGPHV